MILLLVIGVIIGFGVPTLAKVDRRRSVTLTVVICVKNTLLAIFLENSSLNDIDAAVAPALYLSVMLPVAIGVMLLYNWRKWA